MHLYTSAASWPRHHGQKPAGATCMMPHVKRPASRNTMPCPSSSCCASRAAQARQPLPAASAGTRPKTAGTCIHVVCSRHNTRSACVLQLGGCLDNTCSWAVLPPSRSLHSSEAQLPPLEAKKACTCMFGLVSQHLFFLSFLLLCRLWGRWIGRRRAAPPPLAIVLPYLLRVAINMYKNMERRRQKGHHYRIVKPR